MRRWEPSEVGSSMPVIAISCTNWIKRVSAIFGQQIHPGGGQRVGALIGDFRLAVLRDQNKSGQKISLQQEYIVASGHWAGSGNESATTGDDERPRSI